MKPPAVVEKLVPTLYEDDHLLAVAKPAGIDAGAVRPGETLSLAETLEQLRGRGETLQVANPLSRYESGVLLLGKDPTIVRHIRTGLKANRIKMDYVAVVLGRISQSSLVIDSAHGASHGRRPGPPVKARKRRGGPAQAAGMKKDDRRAASDRRTEVKVLQSGRRRTLVLCRTTVENTHALRAQLRAVRLRLLGDSLHDTTVQRQSPGSTCLHLARIAFYHPVLKSKLTITSRQPAAFAAVAQGQWDAERPLLAALTRRLLLIAGADTDSYRVLTGHVENVPGLVAEKHGKVVILQVHDDHPRLVEALPAIARCYRNVLGVQAVYAKRFTKDRSGAGKKVLPGLDSSRPLAGRKVPPEIGIAEHGLSFAIRPCDGLSVGLFLDHRENRKRVRSMAAGKDVLNLFAYTCGFSVVAAAGGAHSTVSVDLSPKHLEWGRVNFARNGLDLTSHLFIKSDAADYIKRARRQGRHFDIVILDPPSFAHGRTGKRSFSIMKDLPELIAGAASLLRCEGVMMISTNYRRLSLSRLRELVKKGAGRRRFRVMEAPRLPLDFAMDPDHAKTVFVRFD